MAKLKPIEGEKGDFYLWLYVPSLAAGAILAALFATATLFVLSRMIRSRTRFSIPFVIGGVLEAVGFAARAYCIENTDQLFPYALQSIFILVAPALFAASIYMILNRLILSVNGERFSIIRVSWLTKIFVIGDILSFAVQSGGGSLMTVQDMNQDIAKAIVIGGLAIQVIVFGLFVITATIFHRRMRRWPSAWSASSTSTWTTTMGMLYATCVLFMGRSIFRIVEFIMGYDGYLSHEWPLYAFDGAPMFLVMVIYGFWYPSNLRSKKEIFAMNGFLPRHAHVEGGHGYSASQGTYEPVPSQHP
ncbi:hypothetical protein ACJ41O_009321 [Fusarium nematophilum]